MGCAGRNHMPVIRLQRQKQRAQSVRLLRAEGKLPVSPTGAPPLDGVLSQCGMAPTNDCGPGDRQQLLPVNSPTD